MPARYIPYYYPLFKSYEQLSCSIAGRGLVFRRDTIDIG